MISSLKGPGEVEAEILMTRETFAGAFLILEGEDDSRFWKPRVSQSNCEIVIGGGKAAVVGGIKRLDARFFRGVVGLVDDDCDRLRGISHGSANIVHTDARDLEGVLLRSGALDKALSEFGDPGKISEFERADGKRVAQALLERALPLGTLRWYSYVTNVGIDFKSLHPARFINQATWSFDRIALIDAAIELGGLPPRATLESKLSELKAQDPWHACQGHDLVAILSIGLAQRLGNKNPGYERIAGVLRAGLEDAELQNLNIHAELRSWESANSPFRVTK